MDIGKLARDLALGAVAIGAVACATPQDAAVQSQNYGQKAQAPNVGTLTEQKIQNWDRVEFYLLSTFTANLQVTSGSTAKSAMQYRNIGGNNDNLIYGNHLPGNARKDVIKNTLGPVAFAQALGNAVPERTRTPGSSNNMAQRAANAWTHITEDAYKALCSGTTLYRQGQVQTSINPCTWGYQHGYNHSNNAIQVVVRPEAFRPKQ